MVGHRCFVLLRRAWKYQRGKSEIVNRRRDDTMVIIKRAKAQTMIYVPYVANFSGLGIYLLPILYSLQSTTQKTKYWAWSIPLESGGELRSSETVRCSRSTSSTRRDTLVENDLMKSWRRGEGRDCDINISDQDIWRWKCRSWLGTGKQCEVIEHILMRSHPSLLTIGLSSAIQL